MPPTIYSQTDPRWKDDPRWNNPSHLRACAEESHYETQRKAFHLPLTIHPSPPPPNLPSPHPAFHTDPTLTFRDDQNRPQSRPLHTLTPNDCRAFCNKDTALYTQSPWSRIAPPTLLDLVYRTWYPQRDRTLDLSHGSFFAKLIRFHAPAPALTLSGIRDFHIALCERVEGVGPIPAWRNESLAKQLEGIEGEGEGGLGMRRTFRDVFVVVHPGWERRGVLMVWGNKRLACEHGCWGRDDVWPYQGGGDPGADGADGDGGGKGAGEWEELGDLEPECVFRCSLVRAMAIVVARDEERLRPRREYNEMLEEMLGGLEQLPD